MFLFTFSIFCIYNAQFNSFYVKEGYTVECSLMYSAKVVSSYPLNLCTVCFSSADNFNI